VSVPKQAVAALVAAVLALALSGCGAAGGGTASQVGDQSVKVSDVDRLTTGYCKALEPQLEAAGQIYPLRYLRGYVVGNLTIKAAAEQFADDYSVTLPASYQQSLKDLETNLETLPAAARPLVLEVESAGTYTTAVQTAVGAQLLAGAGTTDATEAAQQSRGRDAFDVWLGDHPVDINPRYGIAVSNGDFRVTDTSTSYALSPDAVAAGKADPDQEYATLLPVSQRCG
jgi:hypothetical protein